MKIVRIRLEGDEIAYGAVEPEGVRVHQGTPFVAWEPTETLLPFDEVQLLAPVFPTKVVCVGRNYVEHARERDEEVSDHPIIFLKPSTAVIGPGQPIVLPPEAEIVHHEAELAIVVGKVSRKVKAENASAHIIGYTAANDVSARDLQAADQQWTRAKGFDSFCPLGPALETELDPFGLSITCAVNGVVTQDANTDEMVFGVAEIFEFVTGVMTMLPGDVILTGTPAGVSPIVAGDLVEVTIERIGSLANPVVAAS